MNVQLRQDSWVNLTTGIGGPKDKSSGYAFAPGSVGDAWFLLEELYDQDHIAGRIVDALPEAVFSEGVLLECEASTKEDILDCLDELGVEDVIEQAMKWERLHGGAAIFLGVDDGQKFDVPINEQSVRDVLYLHVFDRWELTPARFYTDPTHRKFGRPSHYRVHPSEAGMSQHVGVIVHESRFIKFVGVQTSKRKLIENLYWGQSALVRAYDAIRQYGGALASVLALMSDASQGVYKIKNLLQIIEGGNEDLLKVRFQAIDKLRSSLNSVLLDADGEDYTKIATQLTELGNLIDRFQQNVAAAAVMPVSEIFGRSAAGLNATGENDTRSWYKQVQKAQRKSAKPAYERILRLVLRSQQGPTKGVEPSSWKVTFPPVWSPGAKEQAEIRKIKVETATLAHDLGVVNAEQIARALFSGSEWDSEIVLTKDEIGALQVMASLAGLRTAPPPSAPMDGAVPGLDDPGALTQDDEGEELARLNPRQLASQMTEHGIARCEHGKLNRCQLCGVERHREVVGVDPQGNGIWATAWRAIGERAPPPESDASDAPAPS